MKKIYFAGFIILCTLACLAQSKKIDSLKVMLSKAKTDTDRIKVLGKIGNAYYAKSNDSALMFYQDAMQRAEKSGNTKFQIRARSDIANYLLEIKADYASALDLFLQNIKKETESGDTSMIFWDTRGALFVYERVGNFAKALEYVGRLKALVNSGIFDRNKWLPQYKGIIDLQYGTVYMGLHKPDLAKKYWISLYKVGQTNNDLTWESLTSDALGDLYSQSGQLDSALFYYRTSIPISIKVERPDIYGNCLFGIANLYWKKKKVDSAFFYAIKAYRLIRKEHVNDIAADASMLLSSIYFAKKIPDSAYFYLNESVVLKDSLLSQEKIARVQNLGTQETLQKIKDEQTKKEAIIAYKSQIRIYSLIVGLAVLTFVLLILYRNNIQRKTANKKIEKAYDDLKTTQTQLIQAEKMASLGELTAGIAHEIQNPLNFVNNFSDVNREMLEELKAENQKPKDQRDDQLEAELINDLIENETKINHHGKRADSIVKGMLEHSRISSKQKEPTNINHLTDEYLRLSYHGFRAKEKNFNAVPTAIGIITQFDETIPAIKVIPQEIGRVLLNLFNNAFYAVNQKQKTGDIEYKPEVSVSTTLTNNMVIIKVKDNGIGIPDTIIEKIMQPFFTTKPTGEGTGLGLSLSYDIVVKSHGGNIQVESIEGQGTSFIVTLPIL